MTMKNILFLKILEYLYYVKIHSNRFLKSFATQN